MYNMLLQVNVYSNIIIINITNIITINITTIVINYLNQHYIVY